MPIRRSGALILTLLSLATQPVLGQEAGDVSVQGQLLVNRRVTLDVIGPNATETSSPNPFLDVRMTVRFLHPESGEIRIVPGFFAADGNAGESGASAGNVWRARFTPTRVGVWNWRLSLRRGPGAAIADSDAIGDPISGNDVAGSFYVEPATITGSRLRDRGRLLMAGGHHLQHEQDGSPWIQQGPNSPENLLGYMLFDQTPQGQHQYLPHLQDWAPGDPAWHGDASGRGLIGAMNYLAEQGMNTVNMLVFNVAGDGDDVWPWITKTERLRYDCSKLDQWELLFEHLDDLGISPHIVLGEQEIDDVNDGPLALDSGTLGTQRKLFHRELIARFGHHLGLVINLGEENQNKTPFQIEFYEHIRSLDAWQRPVVVHTFPTTIPVVYPPLLDAGVLQGASLQVLDPADVHATTLDVRGWSEAAATPWFINLDEIGPPTQGLLPDAQDPGHDHPRKFVLWGNLMAGGSGCQWYFGYGWPHDDLDCEDFRSRHEMWRLAALAGEFFDSYLPYAQMVPADELVISGQAWCLAKPGEVYAAYLREGGSAQLELQEPPSTWRVRWFDPRNGGPLTNGTTVRLSPGAALKLSAPASPPGSDWAALIQRLGSPPVIDNTSTLISGYAGDAVQLTVAISDADGDATEVWVHVPTATGGWSAALPADATGDGTWSLLLPQMGGQGSPAWPVVVVASDATGLTDLSVVFLPAN